MDNKEFIVCSAIWYPNFPLVSTKAHLRNPINISDGLVIVGLRHCHCIHMMNSITGMTAFEINNGIRETQGFITSQNRFVNREEALKIAFDCKQITKSLSDKILYSEDLY